MLFLHVNLTFTFYWLNLIKTLIKIICILYNYPLIVLLAPGMVGKQASLKVNIDSLTCFEKNILNLTTLVISNLLDYKFSFFWTIFVAINFAFSVKELLYSNNSFIPTRQTDAFFCFLKLHSKKYGRSNIKSTSL